ncbi:MAG: flavoredoxin [Desulfobulbaceae bacterium]|nr:MAG: flavoredoxin [Desulfobulbaceae bacterium]
MTAAWVGMCCSKPPCLAVSLREATLTHGNIMRTKAFTVHIGTEKLAMETDYFGISTGRVTDKLADTGLTTTASKAVEAPLIEQYPLIIECRLQQVVEVGLHTQFIGEIIDVKADKAILGEKDLPDVDLLKPLVFSPVTRKYHGLGKTVGRAFQIGKKFKTKEE